MQEEGTLSSLMPLDAAGSTSDFPLSRHHRKSLRVVHAMDLQLTPSQNGTARRLVVLVHGLGSSKLMDDVETLVKECLPDADIATAQYNSSLFSNSPADEEAHALALEIGRRLEDKAKASGGYDSIILVGHSIGALLLRAAYLLATGATITTCQPLVRQDWARPGPPPQSEEAQTGPYVERVILLSGLNNGWTTPDPEQLGRFRRIKSAMITALIAWTSFRDKARLMRTVMRGSPFVVDVRLNWLHMINSTELEPQTIHLAGETDDLIKKEDLYDFRSGKNFKHRVVKNTRHYDIGVTEPATVDVILAEFRKKKRWARWFFGWLLPTYNVTKDGGGNRRKELKDALTASWDSIQSQIDPGSSTPVQKDHVVIIRHGIRDDSHGWVSALAKTIVALDPALRITCQKQSYGRFSMLQFLLRGARIRRVYEFMDQYVDLRALYQSANFHFFGHSYGTYIGCKALQHYRTCCFQHVVLANSVMAGDFPWRRLLGIQVSKVLNVRGSRDYIVAWFPGAFQAWREMWGKRPDLREDLLGSAGFSGFRGEVEEGAVRGAHGAGIDQAHFSTIAEFLIRGTNAFRQEPSPNYLVGFIGRLPFIAWATIVITVLTLAFWMGLAWWYAIPFSIVFLVLALHFV